MVWVKTVHSVLSSGQYTDTYIVLKHCKLYLIHLRVTSAAHPFVGKREKKSSCHRYLAVVCGTLTLCCSRMLAFYFSLAWRALVSLPVRCLLLVHPQLALHLRFSFLLPPCTACTGLYGRRCCPYAF